MTCLSFIDCQKKSNNILKETILGLEFVQIPKGSFQMGLGQPDNEADVDSIHRVIISKDFWLGRTEVTQYQWQQIMGSGEMHPEKPSPASARL